MKELVRDLRWWWGEVKLRWKLAMEGEVAILNAIDAVDAALISTDEPADMDAVREYICKARTTLKDAIGYVDEATCLELEVDEAWR